MYVKDNLKIQKLVCQVLPSLVNDLYKMLNFHLHWKGKGNSVGSRDALCPSLHSVGPYEALACTGLVAMAVKKL